jgi:hypothetical protein
VRILSLLAVAVTACYDPAVNDCQFTCPDNQCPGDLMCVGGRCRVPGSAESCPCPTPPAGCSLVTSDTVACLAACSNARDWTAAQAACTATAPWRLAVLDNSSTRTAAETALKSPISWIGLTHTALTADWMWAGGTGSIAATSPEWTSTLMHTGTTTNLCAALDNGKLYSDDCQTSHAYACTSN